MNIFTIKNAIRQYIIDNTNLTINDFIFQNQKFSLQNSTFVIRQSLNNIDRLNITDSHSGDTVQITYDLIQNQDEDNCIDDYLDELMQIFNNDNFISITVEGKTISITDYIVSLLNPDSEYYGYSLTISFQIY